MLMQEHLSKMQQLPPNATLKRFHMLEAGIPGLIITWQGDVFVSYQRNMSYLLFTQSLHF